VPLERLPGDDRVARLRAERLRFARYRAGRDPREREQLIEQYLPLARSLARRYASGDEPLDDLTQVACVGLVKAVDRYDPARGNAFSTYAVPTILGELRRYYRDHSWAMRMPRALQELSLRIEHAWADLAATRGHTPTVRELALRLDTDDETILAALEAAAAHRVDPLVRDGEASNGRAVAPPEQGTIDPGYGLAEDRAVLAGLLATLEPNQRSVLYLRFHEGLTQGEIGRRIGVSQMSVSRILRSSLEQLRAAADAESTAS
jgi:RNA polymerase sigma-B factor